MFTQTRADEIFLKIPSYSFSNFLFRYFVCLGKKNSYFCETFFFFLNASLQRQKIKIKIKKSGFGKLQMSALVGGKLGKPILSWNTEWEAGG